MKNGKFLKFISIMSVVSFLPITTFAAICTIATDPGATGPRIGNLFNYATCIISSSVIPLIFALAMVMFIWGVVQYVINSDEETKKAKGRQFMIWGIVALAVMVSVWGLVSVVGNTFGIKNIIPKVNTQ